MNREELEARVAAAEQRILEVSETLNGLVSLRDKARAELAAMPENVGGWYMRSNRGLLYGPYQNELAAVQAAERIDRNSYCAVYLIEPMPASEEVLEALKQSDFGCHGYCNVKLLAHELRARLPKP